MKVPKDRYQCSSCTSSARLTCESCHTPQCGECLQILWVERNGMEVAHTLCGDCSGMEPE